MLWGRHEVRILKGHRNLLFIVAPLELRTYPIRNVSSEAQGYAFYLSWFTFFFEHTKGLKRLCVFTDQMT